MDPNILKLKVENLVKQKKLDEALILKETAYKYHQSSSEAQFEFLEEIDSLISSTTNALRGYNKGTIDIQLPYEVEQKILSLEKEFLNENLKNSNKRNSVSRHLTKKRNSMDQSF